MSRGCDYGSVARAVWPRGCGQGGVVKECGQGCGVPLAKHGRCVGYSTGGLSFEKLRLWLAGTPPYVCIDGKHHIAHVKFFHYSINLEHVCHT